MTPGPSRPAQPVLTGSLVSERPPSFRRPPPPPHPPPPSAARPAPGRGEGGALGGRCHGEDPSPASSAADLPSSAAVSASSVAAASALNLKGRRRRRRRRGAEVLSGGGPQGHRNPTSSPRRAAGSKPLKGRRCVPWPRLLARLASTHLVRRGAPGGGGWAGPTGAGLHARRWDVGVSGLLRVGCFGRVRGDAVGKPRRGVWGRAAGTWRAQRTVNVADV